MKTIKRVLLLLSIMLVATLLFVVPVCAQEADLEIDTADELKAFATEVNNGNSYEGKLVVLTGNIDLNYTAVVIGTKSNPFKGTFDGQNYIVSNLSIYENGSDSDYFANSDDYLGLFGYMANGTIKNVTVDSPYIVGSSYVAGIVGCAYTGTVENCHVTGEIDIEGFYMVGGITGHGYARIYNCSVVGEEDWDYNYVGATYKEANLEGDNVGGIVGHCAEGNEIIGCTVKNVTVSGTRKVGGILGITAMSSKVENCTVEDVTVETTATADYANDNAKTMSIGGIVGQYMAESNGTGGTLASCTVSGLTFANENDVTVSAGALAGGMRGTTEVLAPTGISSTEGSTTANVTGSTVTYLEPAATYVAEVNGVQYETLADALKAITSGCTVEILSDIVIDTAWDNRYTGAKISVPVTIDGNGYKIKFTNTVYDGGNYHSAFAFLADATVTYLTMDLS